MVPEKIQRELHINSGQLHFVIAINLKGRYANIHGVKVPWGINGSHGAKAGRIKVLPLWQRQFHLHHESFMDMQTSRAEQVLCNGIASW